MNIETLKKYYQDYGYAVHRRCMRIMGNSHDAEDVLQEVFIRALRYGATFDGKNPMGWLYRIADRLCIDAIRKRHRMEPMEPVVLERTSRRNTIAFEGESTIEGMSARQLLAAAPKKDARIAILYYIDGMSQHEVAAEMGCSRKTIAIRLERFVQFAMAYSNKNILSAGESL